MEAAGSTIRPVDAAPVGATGAREAADAEVARYWPQLLGIWPAYAAYYARTGERAVFVLERLQG